MNCKSCGRESRSSDVCSSCASFFRDAMGDLWKEKLGAEKKSKPRRVIVKIKGLKPVEYREFR